MRRTLILLAALAGASPAAAQVFPPFEDVAGRLRLENEQRWLETQQRALQAEVGRLQTDQALRRLQRQSLPDPVLLERQGARDAAEAEALLRAQQAQSTARAARLRSGLAALGYADSLPIDAP